VKTLATICSMGLAVVLFAVCLGVVALRTLGMGTFVVTGGSMEPAIQKGSVVIIEPVAPSLVERGDIVTFERYGQLTTHRVIAVDSRNPADPVFTTKGDANAAADPEPVHFPRQVGLYRAAIPILGYVIAYAQAYWRLALTLVAAVIFLGSAALVVFGNGKWSVRARSRRWTLATVAVDTEELWANHVGWLRESTTRRTSAA
jgi:signal peptidase